jgi:hypothetical protein
MPRPVVAIVTGYTGNSLMLEASFAPLIALKRKGVIDRIHYVTWDKPESDACAALAAKPEVDVVRLPEPLVAGAPYQKGFLYQNRNLAAALALVPEPEALVIKLRPDFIFDQGFLASKILAADFLLAPAGNLAPGGIVMPPSPFKNKIWVAWADANQPFFMEDAAFIGLRCDVGKLASDEAEKLIARCGDEGSSWIAHVLRYIVPFLPDYPVFNRYLESFRYYVQQEKYRLQMLNATLPDPFFRHILIANAWILASSFHIDCGHYRQLLFFPNRFTGNSANQPPEHLPLYSPYATVEAWRSGERPGSLMNAAQRVFGRLMDDSWQTAIFTRPSLSDTSSENLRLMLQDIAAYRSGCLAAAEDAYYAKLAAVHGTHTDCLAA